MTHHLEGLSYSHSEHPDTDEDEESGPEADRGLHALCWCGGGSPLQHGRGTSLLLLSLTHYLSLRVELREADTGPSQAQEDQSRDTGHPLLEIEPFQTDCRYVL